MSVVNQTYPHWELIIVDDCSTDDSLKAINPFLKDARITLIKNEKNQGGNFCRNLGLKLSKGNFILFLDGDDLLTEFCLDKRMAATNKYPDGNLFIFTMGVFYSKPGDASELWIPRSKHPLRDFLQHSLPWSILQPLWKRDLILELQGFDESFLRLQDVELNTRALLNDKVNYHLLAGQPDCYYRIDEGRKNYNLFAFLNRWVDSALNYSNKMERLAPPHLRRFLMGTIYQTYFQVVYHFKLKQISRQEFEELEYKLMNAALVKKSSSSKRNLFNFSKFYNLHLFRIPGFNRLLKACVVA